MQRWILICAAAVLLIDAAAALAVNKPLTASLDPVSRTIHVKCFVPDSAPNRVTVRCSWTHEGEDDWKPALVVPYISETAWELAPSDERNRWFVEKEILERRAAGLTRRLIFNPYPDAQRNGLVDIRFRLVIKGDGGEAISDCSRRIQCDNSDVVYIEDWENVFQKHAVVRKNEIAEEYGNVWIYQEKIDDPFVSRGNLLRGISDSNTPLPQLSYPLNLHGNYAVFVRTPGSICLRFTGDERLDRLSSSRPGQEILWRWGRMDWQHLVLKQPQDYSGWKAGCIDYVKFVPLTDELLVSLNAPFAGESDKTVAGFWESYSWSFHNRIENTLQHREALTAYRDARFTLLDAQVNRVGEKAVYETREADQLLFDTVGDARANEEIPRTANVGRMQQFTNTLNAVVRYARELGLTAHANFGVSECYVGTPLQGDFSKKHPQWLRGGQLRYEIPEVREYALRLFRETLEMGAPGISLDFMRYAQAIDRPQTANLFLKSLRELADEFAQKRGRPVPILVVFPGTGVRLYERFDFETWAKEGWVDYLCPSNDDERHLHLDVEPYQKAVEGTDCKLLPNVTASGSGLPLPGLYLWRVNQLYEAGVDGVYVYQSDARVLGTPDERRCMRLLCSSQNVRQWWSDDAKTRPHRSKGIYITKPSRPNRGWRPRERVRVWLEGLEWGPVEIYLNGELANRYEGPPYLLGTEERDSDAIIPKAKASELRIRAKDGDGWLESTFQLEGEKTRR